MPRARWLAGPVCFAWIAAGWALASLTTGTWAAVGKLAWAIVYVGVFWGGWLGIPLLGVAATFGQPMLPETWRSPARGGFVAWLTAWLGVLVAVWWLGAPEGFQAVPT